MPSRVAHPAERGRAKVEAGTPEYWVLDVKRREIVVHREPCGSGYERVRSANDGETVTARAVTLTVCVTDLL